MNTINYLKAINWRKVNILDVLKGCSEGFLNDIYDREESYKKVVSYRLKQCSECEIYNDGICDPTKQLPHVITGKLVSGCGCNIFCKTALKSAECPAEKWKAIN